MLEAASGVQAVYVGKPQPFVFELALAGMGLSRDEVVMVGDRIDGDVSGARACGIRSVLVRTGEFRPADLDARIEPDSVLDSIADLVGWLMPGAAFTGARPSHRAGTRGGGR